MESAPTTVSVLLPVRNGSATIARAIDSILAQTLQDWELIIVNDGSTDDTAAALAGFDDPRITIIDQAAMGIVPALNLAVSRARSPFLARMDADDWSAPTRLEKQAAYLSDRPERALVSCLVAHEGNDEQEGYRYHVDRINELLSHEQMAARRFEDAPVAHPSVMLRTSALEEVGGYRNGDFPEDFELWLRLLDRGYMFAKLPEVLLHWYDHDARLSRQDARYAPAAFFGQKAAYFKKWHEQQEQQHPIWVCGSGRQVRQRVAQLEEAGLPIAGLVDVKEAGPGTTWPVIGYEELSRESHPLLISLIGDREGKKRLEVFAHERGYTEGKDFWFM